jgi:hypothetical protein
MIRRIGRSGYEGCAASAQQNALCKAHDTAHSNHRFISLMIVPFADWVSGTKFSTMK